MAQVRYIWQGPASAVTLKSTPNDLEVIFLPGKEVTLPDDNEYVRALVSLGHMTTSQAVQAPVVSDGGSK